MFRHLSTKLAVLYAGLFGVGLIFVSVMVYAAITRNAAQAVRGELSASATVFDRVWALRADQLQDSASILARDFGFREAVATRDEATIESALDNLRARLGLDLAFIVDTDGALIGDGGLLDERTADDLWAGLDSQARASGVLMLADTPYQVISAPVMAPVLTGWVVFAARLDEKEMRALEGLSAIELEALVLDRRGKRDWFAASTHASARDQAVMSGFIEDALARKAHAPRKLSTSSGAAIALVKPLKAVSAERPVVLLLRYPLAKALAPYQPLLFSLIAAGITGVLALIAGSWILARGLTRPIQALDEAARRLQKGEDAAVNVESADEIGRLATSFNTMAAEIRERERKITHLALHDDETSLPNRLALERHVEAMIAKARAGGSEGKALIVATLGVDRFETVRGAIGYRLASALMAEIGGRIARLHPECRTARVSSDTLGFVFEAADLEEAKSFVQGLLILLERPHRLNGDTIDVNLTFGMAANAVHGDAAPVLLERASVACDQARAQRRKFAFFDAQAYGDPASNLSLMSDMLRSIVNGDMRLHYQPKYDLRRGRIAGAEALIRWKHPTRGLLPPDLFVGMAEETGAIRTMTEWVLSEAIADQILLGASGHDMPISVNISGRLMNDEDFAIAAINMVDQTDAKLCFEITETAVIDNPQMALDIIAGFVAAGVAISIDDYGAGLSSLTYLKQIRAHELKIDKSFVLSLAEGHRDALLVKSTVDLAHSLGLKVTAEGVETPGALAALAAMGCDYAQGYLIARPMPLEEFLGFVKNEAPKIAARYAAA